MRLDTYLVNQKFFETRNKSKNAIIAQKIKVNGVIIDKPNFDVNENDLVEKINDDMYVSRGAYKLKEAIEHWKINLKDKIVLDVGASTGGFTDFCIQQNAQKVYAIDVGTNQLHHSLKKNKKVISYENTHLKDITLSFFSEKIDLIVADISFISLTKLIDKIVSVFDYPIECVFLIKPQFELSQKEVKNGLVKDKKLLTKATDKIKHYAITNHFNVIGVIESPIKGNKANNTEYLIYLKHR